MCLSSIQLRQLSLFRTDESLLQNLVFFLSDLSLGERKANIGPIPTFCVSDSDLVKISPDRWPAVDGTERPEVSVCFCSSQTGKPRLARSGDPDKLSSVRRG